MADVAIRTEDWRTLPWKSFQRNVFRLQKRIYQAARRGDWKRVHNLQRLLLRLLKQQHGRCSQCGLRFTTEDVLEVRRDGNHANNDPTNLVLLHAHCHDVAHSKRCQ